MFIGLDGRTTTKILSVFLHKEFTSNTGKFLKGLKVRGIIVGFSYDILAFEANFESRITH